MFIVAQNIEFTRVMVSVFFLLSTVISCIWNRSKKSNINHCSQFLWQFRRPNRTWTTIVVPVRCRKQKVTRFVMCFSCFFSSLSEFRLYLALPLFWMRYHIWMLSIAGQPELYLCLANEMWKKIETIMNAKKSEHGIYWHRRDARVQRYIANIVIYEW